MQPSSNSRARRKRGNAYSDDLGGVVSKPQQLRLLAKKLVDYFQLRVWQL